jgi:hypothetical protein
LAFPSSPFHEAKTPRLTPNASCTALVCFEARPLLRTPVLLVQCPGWFPDRQVPRAPSPASGVTSGGEALTAPPRWALPHRLRYYVLMCQSRTLLPPRCYDLARPVFAGCCQPLLGTAPSRRYPCESFLGCLDLYPGGPHGAYARFFPCGFGLPCSKNRSALHEIPYSDFGTGSYFGAAVIR